MKKVLVLLFFVVGFCFSYAQQTADGWTILDPNKAEKIIYVSSSVGNDNTGVVYSYPSSIIGDDPFLPTNPIQAFQSVEAAISSIEDGEAVWVLLKRGDVFYKTLRPVGGKSEDQPFLYSSYGTSNELPLLKTGSNAGVFHCCDPLEHFWIVGLSFYAHTRDPDGGSYESDAGDRGIYLETIRGRKLNNILIEGNVVKYYRDNVIQSFNGSGIVTNITVRRNMFLDGYNSSQSSNHSVGFFAQNVNGFLMEENIFDHNGWLIPTYGNSAGQDKADGQATQFSHNTYFVDNKNVTFRNNSFNRPSSNATKWVSTALGRTENILIENNLFNDCEIAVSMGANYPETSHRFKSIDIKNNVIVDQGLSNLTKRGLAWGLDVQGWDGGIFSNNIITSQQTSTNSGFAVRIAGKTRHVTIGGNIFYDLQNRRGVLISDKGNYENLLITQNSLVYDDNFKRFVRLEIGDFSELTFDRNNYYNADNISRPFVILNQDYELDEWRAEFPNENATVDLPDYPDPTRNLDRYISEVLGLPNRDAYYAELRNQNIFNWREVYTGNAIAEWIEKGFDSTSDVTPPVPSNESLPDVVRECSLESLEAPTALDEISGNVQGVTDISFPITESTILVWTYEDQEGNKSYQEQQIIIDDTEAPVLDVAELPDLNGECSVIIENIPTATDFCLGSISGVTDIDISQEVKTTQTIVWTFTDSSGNSITQTQKVNIQQDNGAVFDEPELVDIVADCSVIITNIPTASDFCQGQITATANIDINDVIRESTTIIWTYNAGSDNAISQTQEVIIQQNDGFALDEPELADIIAECGTIITSIPTASDFCQGQITAIADIDINEAIRESTTITWTYDTGTDNPLSQTQNVIITDNQEPTVNDEDFQVLTGECYVFIENIPFANDVCDGLIQGIPNVELGMPITESSSVTWSFTDSSGNIYYRQQEVLITADSSAPVPVLAALPDIVDQCDVQQPEAPIANDACDGAISAVPNIDFPIVDENVTEIIWTYQDSSGNSIFQTQKVILTKPVGCTAGNVTINDFQFSVTNEQCYDQNNGSISILAAKPAPYNVTVQKVIGLQSKHQFDDTLNVDKLPPGDYNVCINIEGFDIEICKTLSILAAENLEVMYEVNDADKEIKVSMTGGDEYLITLNGTTITTAESELVLDLEWGTNELTVQTENECQDDFELSIETSKDLSFFPNPVSQGPLNLSLKGIPNRPTEFSILAMSGKIVKIISDVRPEDDQLVIDVAGFTPGTYIVKAVSSDKTYSFTFIKI